MFSGVLLVQHRECQDANPSETADEDVNAAGLPLLRLQCRRHHQLVDQFVFLVDANPDPIERVFDFALGSVGVLPAPFEFRFFHDEFLRHKGVLSVFGQLVDRDRSSLALQFDRGTLRAVEVVFHEDAVFELQVLEIGERGVLQDDGVDPFFGRLLGAGRFLLVLCHPFFLGGYGQTQFVNGGILGERGAHEGEDEKCGDSDRFLHEPAIAGYG